MKGHYELLTGNTGLYMILISDQYIFIFRILMCFFFSYTSGGRSISKQELLSFTRLDVNLTDG